MSRPWMPLYIGAYLKNTAHLTTRQHGAYLLLIMHYWTAGGLPSCDQKLSRIAKLSNAQWKHDRPTIVAFFQEGWQHERIDSELKHAAEVSEKRRKAVYNRYNKSNTNVSGLYTHTQTQEEKKDIAPDGASKAGRKYAYEGGVIRLTQKDFDKWQQAFSHVDLRAELVALEYWAGKQPDWFHAVKHALAKRNREQKRLMEKNQEGNQEPTDWKRVVYG